MRWRDSYHLALIFLRYDVITVSIKIRPFCYTSKFQTPTPEQVYSDDDVNTVHIYKQGEWKDYGSFRFQCKTWKNLDFVFNRIKFACRYLPSRLI